MATDKVLSTVNNLKHCCHRLIVCYAFWVVAFHNPFYNLRQFHTPLLHDLIVADDIYHSRRGYERYAVKRGFGKECIGHLYYPLCPQPFTLKVVTYGQLVRHRFNAKDFDAFEKRVRGDVVNHRAALQGVNQLLTEMDGFGTNSGVIILAATNRADILDKALLRAGRFDRQIYVDLPDLNDRVAIFNVHLRKIKTDETVDVDLLARQTPGFSGADIANVCNEAALIAARHNKQSVGRQDFIDAVDRIIGGLEKRSKITTDEEKRSIAVHEAGHATVSWHLRYANPLIKVTIVPRGKALGAAWYLPEERQITPTQALLDEMCSTLGGRAAEELFIGHISTGAANDLERVTKQAYAMVAYYGMSDRLPNLCYYDSTGQDYGFSKPYSDERARLIDEEVSRIISEQYERAKEILRSHAEGHGRLADTLISREVIFTEDVEKIFGKRQWASRTDEILAANQAEGDTNGRSDSDAAGESDSHESSPSPATAMPALPPAETASGDSAAADSAGDKGGEADKADDAGDITPPPFKGL